MKYGVTISPSHKGLPVLEPSSNKKPIIIIVVVIAVILVFIVVGVAVGVGVTIGTSKSGDHPPNSPGGNNGNSGNSTNVGGGGDTTAGPLSPPSVTCTYNATTTPCGCSANKPSLISTRVVNGNTAAANSWPWIVALYINNDRLCDGFLVSYQHVITAGHCVDDITSPSSVVVYAGIQTRSRRFDGQTRVASAINLHPGYSEASGDTINDIAIITLASPLTQTTTVGKCCLPSDSSLPNVGEHGVVAGWGKASSASNTDVSDTLQQAVLEVQNPLVCNITSTTNIRFCGGSNNNANACFGDSGTPFMTGVNNLWTCTGIVSTGRTCGQSVRYTRISAYQSFINSIING